MSEPFFCRWRYADNLEGDWSGHSARRAMRVFCDMTEGCVAVELWHLPDPLAEEPIRLAYYSKEGTGFGDPVFLCVPCLD